MKVLAIVLILSIISAILYRMGGSDTYNTKWRDLGCSLCATLCCLATLELVYNVETVLALVAVFALIFASLTTYFKEKGKDTHWWNWLIVGLMFGIAALPLPLVTHHWGGFLLRTAFLGASVCVWSQTVDNVVWEECGRGFLLTVSILLLMF